MSHHGSSPTMGSCLYGGMKDDVLPQESCDHVLQYLESSGSDLGKLVKIMWKGKESGKIILGVDFLLLLLISLLAI